MTDRGQMRLRTLLRRTLELLAFTYLAGGAVVTWLSLQP